MPAMILTAAAKPAGRYSTRGRLRPLRRLSWSNHIGVHYD
jgi:hypothetical protein